MFSFMRAKRDATQVADRNEAEQVKDDNKQHKESGERNVLKNEAEQSKEYEVPTSVESEVKIVKELRHEMLSMKLKFEGKTLEIGEIEKLETLVDFLALTLKLKEDQEKEELQKNEAKKERQKEAN